MKFKGDQGAASNPDEEFMSALTPEERRSTMHGAPLWARSATVFAGPLFNFILSFCIFFFFIMYYGVEREPLTIESVQDTPYGISELEPGDVILEIGGMPADTRQALSDTSYALTPKMTLDYRSGNDR